MILDSRAARPQRHFGRWSLVALAVALAAAGIFVLARAVMLHGAVLPGTTVAGVDVGGRSAGEAEAVLERALGERLDRTVRVGVGNGSFATRPNALFELDAEATRERALASGRESVWTRLFALTVPVRSRDVEPVLRLRPDGRENLSYELLDLTRRASTARVVMKDGAPVVVPGRFGTSVDEAEVIEAVRAASLAGSRSVEAAVRPMRPAITTAQARAAAARAEVVVSAPVTITFEGERLGALSPVQLASLLRFQPGDGGYELVLAREPLARALAPIAVPKTKAPTDATFEVAGKRVRVVPSSGGTQVAAKRAAWIVLAAAQEPELSERTSAITLTKREADLTTRDAKALGIREQISTFTTLMGESSANRIHNVQLLGRYLDGTILKPGETFSFNDVIGPRTAERGFLEGQMILGGLLVPSIGGGVCQTATTIFNAAFEIGLPVVKRYNHSFYISHYPVGRDATVSWGGPHLVFKNDLDHAILMKAHGTATTFTVTFYGTDPNRKVVSSTSERTNYTQPTLQYAVDPSAPANSVRTTEGGGPGFDVNVHRKVYEDGKLIREDDFFTRYVPENPTAIYGPGRTPPGPYFTLPPTA